MRHDINEYELSNFRDDTKEAFIQFSAIELHSYKHSSAEYAFVVNLIGIRILLLRASMPFNLFVSMRI